MNANHQCSINRAFNYKCLILVAELLKVRTTNPKSALDAVSSFIPCSSEPIYLIFIIVLIFYFLLCVPTGHELKGFCQSHNQLTVGSEALMAVQVDGNSQAVSHVSCLKFASASGTISVSIIWV
jgi:hypothetical protein